MSRRGENIYKRKDGRWEGRIHCGYQDNGKRKYRSIYAKSYKELKDKMESEKPLYTSSGKIKLIVMRDILLVWLNENQLGWKQSTYACYSYLVTQQILPQIGNIPVQQFTNNLYGKFIEEKKNGSIALSDSYIKNITSILLQAMRYAKREYDPSINVPCIHIRREMKTEKNLPKREDIIKLEKYVNENTDNCTCLGVLICLYTGIRIGELCALTWNDINIEEGMLTINKTLQRVPSSENKTNSKIMITTPKTHKANRKIPIPHKLTDILLRNKESPTTYLIKGFKTPYAEPRTVQYRFQSILKKCSIKPFNFHMLRHYFATQCIHSNFDINTVSDLLGHSNVQITLNLYVHSTDEHKISLMRDFEL